MSIKTLGYVLSGLIIGSIARGQTPTTRSAVGAYDLSIVKRVEQILSSPDRWNRADTAACSRSAKTFSLLCALQTAVDEAALATAPRPGATTTQTTARVDCRFGPTSGKQEGSCGLLWEEVP